MQNAGKQTGAPFAFSLLAGLISPFPQALPIVTFAIDPVEKNLALQEARLTRPDIVR